VYYIQGQKLSTIALLFFYIPLQIAKDDFSILTMLNQFRFSENHNYFSIQKFSQINFIKVLFIQNKA
jgi:hypothetical protein